MAHPQSTSSVFFFFSFRQNSLSSPSLICNLQSSCLSLLSTMISRVLYHGWLSNRTSCNNTKVKNMETVSFDTHLKTVSTAFRLKWLRIEKSLFSRKWSSERLVCSQRSFAHSTGFWSSGSVFAGIDGNLWASCNISKSKMEKHAPIKPDFQYLCFGPLEFYRLCRAAQAVPGLAVLRCPWEIKLGSENGYLINTVCWIDKSPLNVGSQGRDRIRRVWMSKRACTEGCGRWSRPWEVQMRPS